MGGARWRRRVPSSEPISIAVERARCRIALDARAGSHWSASRRRLQASVPTRILLPDRPLDRNAPASDIGRTAIRPAPVADRAPTAVATPPSADRAPRRAQAHTTPPAAARAAAACGRRGSGCVRPRESAMGAPRCWRSWETGARCSQGTAAGDLLVNQTPDLRFGPITARVGLRFGSRADVRSTAALSTPGKPCWSGTGLFLRLLTRRLAILSSAVENENCDHYGQDQAGQNRKFDHQCLKQCLFFPATNPWRGGSPRIAG